MASKWRRFEMLLPLQFNDGREVPPEWLAAAVLEVVDHFGAASYETQKLEGHWRHGGVTYRDDLVKIVVDVPDTSGSRRWMREFKSRWKSRLEQLELWLISYRIEIELAINVGSASAAEPQRTADAVLARRGPRRAGGTYYGNASTCARPARSAAAFQRASSALT